MNRIKLFVLRRPKLRSILFFFPLQLLMVQIKKNHTILLFWLLLFGFITSSIASRYGVGYLFLDPEYLDRVGFWSYLIVGFSCGGFIMAYQISCYVRNAYRFPFLATLSNPFIKFCWNNFIIPTLFLVVYGFQLHYFLRGENTAPGVEVFYIASFLLGVALFILPSLWYFSTTNTDLNRLYGVSTDEEPNRKYRVHRIVLRRKSLQWKNLDVSREARDWHVETYLVRPLRIRRAQSFEHYDKEMLIQVFRQNHRNALLFGILVIITLLILGLFRDYPLFMLPAGASIFLLFTLYLTFTSILYTWFRGWSNVVLIVLLLLFNWLHQFNVFGNRTMAFGMKYSGSKAAYTSENLSAIASNRDNRVNDSLAMLKILENWKAKNTVDTLHKPKLVLFNCSGGGLRSTLWTFYTLQCADSISDGKFMKRIPLIAGSSGGMLGAAYMRELYSEAQKNTGNNCDPGCWRDSISRDILNPVSFSIAVNDWFLPIQKVNVCGERYSKNRAFAFEQKFVANTGSRFDKALSDYRTAEASAEIPVMVFSPTVVNDGRKMLISAQGVSWLTQPAPHPDLHFNNVPDAIEFSRLFSAQNADSVRFSSVLRMNATFPYITPLTELPSDPVMEVFDAGMRDNYGIETSLRFIYTFRDWIEKNTSGVVIVQTRDMAKDKPTQAAGGRTVSSSLSKPLSSFYGNLFTVQNYNQDHQIEMAAAWFKGKIDVLDFELVNEENDRISLSWHLTQKEKNKVVESMKSATNQQSLQRLKTLLSPLP